MNNNFSDFRKYLTNTKINGCYTSGLVIDDVAKSMSNPNMLSTVKNIKDTLATNNIISPNIVETSTNFGYTIDIFSALIKDNIIFLGDEINADMANVVTGQLLYLSNQDPESKISIYIGENFGGDVYAGCQILNLIDYISNPVATVTQGLAASMAAVIAISGSYGMRFMMPDATMMIHQPISGAHGPAIDLEINVNECNRLKKLLFTEIANRSGHTYDEILNYALRDKWIDSQECLDMHFCDKILELQKSKKMTYNEWLKENEK